MSEQDVASYVTASLFSLKGKTALVTGGSSGLGLIMAKGLLCNGVRVVIASRSQEKCDMALSELSEFGECWALAADVTKSDDRDRLLDFVAEKMGGLSAVFSLTRDAIPLLAESAAADDPSRIINIGSMDGIHVPIVQRIPTFAYSASKAALHHLTRSLAVDLAPRHITVNAIAPGFFESRMTDYVFEHYKQDDCPLHRVGRPEEIVGIVTYLASRAGAYTNGTVIPVDGGTSISKGKRPWME